MSSRFRRPVLITAVALIGWYVIVLLLWAVQPLSDSIPVSIDHSLKKYEPAGRQISQQVDCNTLFAGSARDAGPLPALPVQLPGYEPMQYPPRAACVGVQRDARIVFGLNTVFVLVGLAGLVLVNRRYSNESPRAAGDQPVSALPA
ncbi:MAG: hypothetical protein ABIR32_18255 [Ilumatobacteraceae bacterium]